MGLKGLAEAIILQSIADMWDDQLKEGCVTFFKGKDFRTCAEAAGMTVADQVKLLHMVKDVIEYENRKFLSLKNGPAPDKKKRKWQREMSALYT